MNDNGILRNLETRWQNQLFERLEVITVHCAKCKKFKKKNTNSIYCFKCLGVGKNDL